jgi:cyclopropane fatty-acyl-phospholipid synthase-like methyltransferase
MDILRKLIKKRIFNNKWVNPVFYAFGIDGILNDYSQDYVDYEPDTTRSLQEIAGYADKPEINRALDSLHAQVKACIEEQMKLNNTDFRILELGCGPGLYLQDFRGKCKLTGIDVSKAMCKLAKVNVPEADIINDHFLRHPFTEKFDAIYSVGVLMYFSKSQVKKVFEKMHAILKPQGVVFISYPHAFREKDLSYHDYTYVHYSPQYIEQLVSPNFSILHHRHQDGKKKVTDYDRSPYIEPGNYDNRSYVNNYIIILRKK